MSIDEPRPEVQPAESPDPWAVRLAEYEAWLDQLDRYLDERHARDRQDRLEHEMRQRFGMQEL
jgi:hypothetical protein